MIPESEIDEWFHRYVDDINNYLVHFTGNKDVEDLVQDTFIRALLGLQNFRGASHPKTWLLSIARNVAIDNMRRNRRTATRHFGEIESIQSVNLQPEEIFENNEAVSSVMNEINRLKQEYREVVVLRLMIGLSIAETCETLGWSESKVKSTQHRAMKQLRRVLAGIERSGTSYDCI
jgi:RNA polymerase sigma-70 factor (ECF subfamily)